MIKSLVWVPLLLLIAVAFMSQTAAQEQADPSVPIKNLQFQSADIKSVLTFLADYGGVNVVIAPEVDGTVTIKLKDVKWRSAMDIIGRTYDLAVVDEEDGYIRVLPAEQYRKEVTEMEKHRRETMELAKLETRIVKIANSTSDDVVAAVKSLMTERGTASSDPRSNSIILQEVPSNIENVMNYIAELDKPAKQIKISARLLEIFTEDAQELGIDWGASGTYTTESGREYPQSVDINTDRTTDNALKYRVTALQHGWSAQAVVDAIVQSDKGRIIAHPEITTIDNKQAKIQMGQKIPVKQFDEAGNVVIKFEEVGTILLVTPHLTAEDQILMELSPERSTYQFDPNGVIINTSNAKTNVIVNNGQTAVIGGLTTEDEVETEIGVPILKDIPLIGRLFKYTNKRTESRDLIIFVTPTIVDENLAMEG
ncbi:MAG: secretin N-terminal domain-containing protein [Candidatus Zixiibacteriota bacterium]